MAFIDGMLQELEQEAQTTRRVLERVPGQSAYVEAPREVTDAGPAGASHRHGARRSRRARDVTVARSGAAVRRDPSPAKAADLLPALDESIAKAKKLLGGMDDGRLMETWRLMNGDREIFAIPRAGFLRAIMLNHWYHHRGQLSVYLRELGVPVPSIYGPSADENPFM